MCLAVLLALGSSNTCLVPQNPLQDLLRRPRGLPRAVFNPITNPGRTLGYSEWGFTKAGEVFAGRWVQPQGHGQPQAQLGRPLLLWLLARAQPTSASLTGTQFRVGSLCQLQVEVLVA